MIETLSSDSSLIMFFLRDELVDADSGLTPVVSYLLLILKT